MGRGFRLPSAGRSAAFVCGCVLAIGLGECGLRITARGSAGAEAPPSRSSEMLRFSSDIRQGWELRPRTLDHNRAGFRGRLVSEEKPAGVFRIATVGDSVTYGIGVEAAQTFTAVLERLLNATGEGRFEALNFGVPGYGTHQVRQRVGNSVVGYAPDLVVMTFTPDDVETTPVVIEVGGDMCLFDNPLEGSVALDSALHWSVYRQSHLYRLIYKALGLLLGPPAAPGGGARVDPEGAWRNVEEVRTMVEDSGARFLLVLSPPVLPVCDAEGNPIATPEVITRPLELIRTFARENGVDFLDLEPIFAPYSGRLKVASRDHEHFNALGHRLVAEALVSEIVAQSVPDPVAVAASVAAPPLGPRDSQRAVAPIALPEE